QFPQQDLVAQRREVFIGQEQGGLVRILAEDLARIEHVQALLLQHRTEGILEGEARPASDLLVRRDQDHGDRDVVLLGRLRQVAEEAAQVVQQRRRDSLVQRQVTETGIALVPSGTKPRRPGQLTVLHYPSGQTRGQTRVVGQRPTVSYVQRRQGLACQRRRI